MMTANKPSYKTHDPVGWMGDGSRGAAMGRSSIHNADTLSQLNFIVAKVELDGDYDCNGTYWGSREDSCLFWCASDDGSVDFVMDAQDRNNAINVLKTDHYPNATILPDKGNESMTTQIHGDLEIDGFTFAYITAALWTDEINEDEQGNCPLEGKDISDMAASALQKAVEVCTKFQKDNADLLLEVFEKHGADDSACGHDLWLTRNGHGVGFWDRDYEKQLGDNLTAAAKEIGESSLYLGDDGQVYFA